MAQRKQIKHQRVVLVGTYKGDQLAKWRGWYNYPISDGDFNAESQRGRDGRAGSPLPADFAQVNELWLFKGTKEERRYKAEFVGIKTREELIRDYGYPAGNGRARSPSAPPKPHGDRYALFKTQFLYRHEDAVPEDAERVIIRIKDFARSPKVRKQLKAYLESSDRKDPDFAKRLPEIITKLRPEQLQVCELAYQMSLWELPNCEKLKPPVPFPPPEHPKFTFIDLFAGIGGIRLGYQSLGGKCVFSSEWDKATAKTYFSNFGEMPFGDIQKIEPKDIPDFDVLLAGFPCQPFLIIGSPESADGFGFVSMAELMTE